MRIGIPGSGPAAFGIALYSGAMGQDLAAQNDILPDPGLDRPSPLDPKAPCEKGCT